MKNAGVAVGLLCVAIGAWVLLPTGPWTSVWTAMLALAGVVLLKGEKIRRIALVLAAVAASTVGLELIVSIGSPQARRPVLTRVVVPGNWIEPDAILGYRLSPNTSVLDTARYGDELIYRAFYNIDGTGARVTPQGRPEAGTYLFLGDSFVFGQGLSDEDSVAAQFTQATGGAIRGINLGVPGYGPNHFVRALEAGLIDRSPYRDPRAVVTWIIPAQLARITGDGEWLASSPRYILRDGIPEFSGSFRQHRWTNPAAGLAHLFRSNFAFARTIGTYQEQLYQVELFVALLSRMKELVRAQLGARLIVAYSWPDQESHPNYSGSEVPQPLLAATITELRRRNISLVSMNRLIIGKDPSQLLIPHDGHPTAFSNKLLAAELARRATAIP